jgi:hypothetical protein
MQKHEEGRAERKKCRKKKTRKEGKWNKEAYKRRKGEVKTKLSTIDR